MSEKETVSVENFSFETEKYYSIYCYDHYSSGDINEEPCVMWVSGVCKKIEELYVKLVHIKSDVKEEDSAIEVHNIFILAIISVEELKSEKILLNSNFKLENFENISVEDIGPELE